MDKAFELKKYEDWLHEALVKAFNTDNEKTKRDLSLEIWYCRENIERIKKEVDEEELIYDIPCTEDDVILKEKDENPKEIVVDGETLHRYDPTDELIKEEYDGSPVKVADVVSEDGDCSFGKDDCCKREYHRRHRRHRRYHHPLKAQDALKTLEETLKSSEAVKETPICPDEVYKKQECDCDKDCCKCGKHDVQTYNYDTPFGKVNVTVRELDEDEVDKELEEYNKAFDKFNEEFGRGFKLFDKNFRNFMRDVLRF